MNENSIIETEQKKTKTLNERPYFSTFLLTAGVILPLIALFVELGTRMCAKDLFDPIPSWWHVLFVAFVPITNLQVWYAVTRGKIERLSWLGFANAAAIFISLFYTIIFLPLIPVALIGILLLLGFLPLAPIFSLLAGFLLRRQLKQIAPPEKPFNLQWKGLIAAGVLIFFAFGLAELPFTFTKMGIRQANAKSAVERDKGVKFLRNYGNKDYLLRLSYGDSEINATDFIVFVVKNLILKFEGDNKISKEDARRAYYLLTGKSYRSLPVPRSVRHWQRFDDGVLRDENGMILIDGLKLADSQMDGSVDGDATLGYLEWTLVFKNETSRQQEAVSQIQLPPDAVVSRLTLWINGEEREAAFAKRAKVTEAYEKVTATKRDPALLTVSGKDRVSLKCFPVPPNGEMKVRIGITMPLILENETNSLMLMPYFQEKNFGIATEHSVWIESKKQLEIANPNFENKQEDNFFAVRGNVKDDGLLTLGSPVRIGKTETTKISWAKDTNGSETIVKQEIVENTSPKAESLIFVVDTSASMKEFQNGIAETIKSLPADIETTLIFTNGNGYNTSSGIMGQNPADIAWYISDADFAGGTDSVSAIETAYKLADAKPNSAIIRLYAPQIVELSSPETLLQFRRRRPDVSPIYSLQTKRGKDVIDAQLISSNAVRIVPRFGTFNDDLKKFLAELTGQNKTFKAVRTIEKVEDFTAPANSKETSQHLVRLWANVETEKLAETGKDDEAIELAIKNQLVTSVSGAVVLETQQQYDQFGLKPVSSNTVPTIPEPEEYLLFAVVLLVLFWFFRKFRNQNLQTA